MKARLPLLFALVALSHAASAVVVNIDFNTATSATFSGQAAAPDTAGNNYWNSLQNVTGTAANATPLRDSSNTTNTTISISITGIDGSINNTSANAEQEVTSGHSSLMRDYIRVDSTSSTLVKTSTGTISGLVPSADYEIYLYGQGEFFTGGTANNQRGQNTLFDIGGVKKQTGWDTVLGGNGSLAEDIEYVRYVVTASAGGEITFSWSNVVPGVNVVTDNAPNPNGGGSRFAALNGIQIRSVPVPEPAAAFLGGLGLLGILVRRRR